MKRENIALYIVLFAVKELITISATALGFIALLASWRYSDKGWDGFFAADFTRNEALTLGLAFLFLISIIWAYLVVKEMLKRHASNLHPAEDDASGPVESLMVHGRKMFVNWTLISTLLVAAAAVVSIGRGMSPEDLSRVLWPTIMATAIIIGVAVLADMAWTALLHKLKSLLSS